MDRDGHDPEWLVRKRRIDPILDNLGWSRQSAIPAAGAARVEEYETTNGRADYALGLDGQVLGVVEVKKLTRCPFSPISGVGPKPTKASAESWRAC